jgi:hypothetical protein
MTAVAHRTTRLVALATLALAVAGCSSGDDEAAAGATPAGTSAAVTYSTQQFAVPFSVTPDPDVVQTSPAADTEGLVSFDSVDGTRKVRFLAPTNTYSPGSSATMDPPADFIGYLHDQAANGITVSDETTTTVDGRPATLVSVSSDPSRPEGFYDGSLGCASPDQDPKDPDAECFGVQPDLPLRMAVIDVDGTLLLAWARPDDDPGTSEDDFHHDFETMLGTVQFT